MTTKFLTEEELSEKIKWNTPFIHLVGNSNLDELVCRIEMRNILCIRGTMITSIDDANNTYKFSYGKYNFIYNYEDYRLMSELKNADALISILASSSKRADLMYDILQQDYTDAFDRLLYTASEANKIIDSLDDDIKSTIGNVGKSLVRIPGVKIYSRVYKITDDNMINYHFGYYLYPFVLNWDFNSGRISIKLYTERSELIKEFNSSDFSASLEQYLKETCLDIKIKNVIKPKEPVDNDDTVFLSSLLTELNQNELNNTIRKETLGQLMVCNGKLFNIEGTNVLSYYDEIITFEYKDTTFRIDNMYSSVKKLSCLGGTVTEFKHYSKLEKIIIWKTEVNTVNNDISSMLKGEFDIKIMKEKTVRLNELMSEIPF